jgi:3-hydroxyisobutyrate dehydrogenase-like beta-hydroxyacid dehydrogenase
MFMVGGADEPVAAVRPVLEPLGRALFHLGPLGAGNTMKLVNSLVAYTATWSSLEGLSLAAKAGIEVPRAVEVLRTGGAGNFFLDRMVEGIDQRGRPTQFALELAAKDARLVVETGESLGVPTPTASAIAGVLAGAVELGLGGADWSELVAVAERLGDVTLRWSPDA